MTLGNIQNQMITTNSNSDAGYKETRNKAESSTTEAESTKVEYRCDTCEYQSKKEITLKQHKNTKHFNFKKNNMNISVSTQEKFSKFHCDECDFTCQTKKILKRHKAINHVISTNSQDKKCENCGKKFSDQEELFIHMEQSNPTCKCTADSVCDDCIDEWANKS